MPWYPKNRVHGLEIHFLETFTGEWISLFFFQEDSMSVQIPPYAPPHPMFLVMDSTLIGNFRPVVRPSSTSWRTCELAIKTKRSCSTASRAASLFGDDNHFCELYNFSASVIALDDKGLDVSVMRDRRNILLSI